MGKMLSQATERLFAPMQWSERLLWIAALVGGPIVFSIGPYNVAISPPGKVFCSLPCCCALVRSCIFSTANTCGSGPNPWRPCGPVPHRIGKLYELMVAAGPGATDKERLDNFDKLRIELHDALGSSPGFHAYGRKISGNWVDDLVDRIPGLMQVPLKFWTDGGDIEWHTVDVTKQRERCVARQTATNASGEPGYFDLQFDRDQIARLWPQMKLLSNVR